MLDQNRHPLSTRQRHGAWRSVVRRFNLVAAHAVVHPLAPRKGWPPEASVARGCRGNFTLVFPPVEGLAVAGGHDPNSSRLITAWARRLRPLARTVSNQSENPSWSDHLRPAPGLLVAGRSGPRSGCSSLRHPEYIFPAVPKLLDSR